MADRLAEKISRVRSRLPAAKIGNTRCPSTDEDPKELEWRRSIRPGDEVAVAYHNTPEYTGVAYQILKVAAVEDGIIKPTDPDADHAHFYVETGLQSTRLTPPPVWQKIVPPTAEIRTRIAMVAAAEEFILAHIQAGTVLFFTTEQLLTLTQMFADDK